MPGPYFPIPDWPSFVHEGFVYTFEHLREYEFSVTDSAEMERRVGVTFSDHVFTRDSAPSDKPGTLFPTSSRNPPGAFCPIRYSLSLRIREWIAWTVEGHAWILDGDDRFAQIPLVDDQGGPILYAIVFSLDPVRGLPVDLHMRVRSAYPCDHHVPMTYGNVRFRHLVRLRVEGRRPGKNLDKRRKKPNAPPSRGDRT
jgi:hypothetical protein